MTSWLVALLVALGGAAWVWNKTMRSTNRQDTSITVSIAVGVIIFLVLISVFKLFLHF